MNVPEQHDALINACKKGQRQAQSKLYALFAPKMFSVCLRYAGSREEAQDILQEGFVKVFEHLDQFKSKGSFEGWMRRIFINTALGKLRSNQNALRTVTLEEDTSMLRYASNETLQHLHTKHLIEMVQSLPNMYRLVFNLYVFEDMKHREIAALLGISEGTSKSNLSDARKILQKKIESHSLFIKRKLI